MNWRSQQRFIVLTPYPPQQMCLLLNRELKAKVRKVSAQFSTFSVALHQREGGLIRLAMTLMFHEIAFFMARKAAIIRKS
mmetsp:Transcript_22663/g.33984  ORF Transcript_22663/g.33984 Transcript_22663/m.33984 type:complete len:80 (+) Transcript_22663:2287-2526(+)